MRTFVTKGGPFGLGEGKPQRIIIRSRWPSDGLDITTGAIPSGNMDGNGGKLPVIIIFVDTDEHVSRVLPTLKEMAAHRLIVRENVVLEQGNLD